ncbi:hypothetical protein CEUSTIGMA_g5848.t1 [Chlamydomonas eustigma]|uniref:Nicastrin n=1 Tax=Chlamydomonas eustigma TaxID=1157962 RepID=A0A250X5T5_9CHLO|nr:hypothetical protein CEUSTIGMA_g5848.t1 [Chlamydomonas eustigma]|eukprot:GAX78406.1 hypothetical protein CEUSTIGMA_g5848.t1 [Chlamydomonas eustigma]
MLKHHALVFVSYVCFSLRLVRGTNYQSVGAIGNAMYTYMAYSGGWYMNLNINGSIGSQGNPEGVVSGTLMHASDVEWPLEEGGKILVVGIADVDSLLLRLLSDPVSSKNVVGVLMDSNSSLPSNMSSVSKFPGAFNAPYNNTDYVWNPWGTNLQRSSVPFPVIRMSSTMSINVLPKLRQNQVQNYEGALYQADLTMSMYAEHNSTYCLLAQGLGCQPLGGFSVWASIPPMAPLIPNLTNTAVLRSGQGALVAPSSKPITLVISQINSVSLFHDYTQGSDAPLSGLIAMLTAMTILKSNGVDSNYDRQLAFLAVAGEDWDYMGSRRLLLDMSILNTTSTSGLNLALIDQVIEIGQIGKGFNSSTGLSELFVHSQRPGKTQQNYGNPDPLIRALLNATNETNEIKANMMQADVSNPGVPPSTLMSFLRHKPSIQGVVITDFDQHFKNTYYKSELDLPDQISIQAIISAAVITARTLHSLASPSHLPVTPLSINITQINDLVYSLAACLMLDGPAPNGLLCDLVQYYINVGYTSQNAEGIIQPFPWRYVGLVAADSADPTNVTNKREIFNFLFNFMAEMSASNNSGVPCDPFVNFCQSGQVCMGWKSGQNASVDNATMGRCLTSTTRFTIATSTRIYYVNQSDNLVMLLRDDFSEVNMQYGWPPDPVWTESYWSVTTPTIKVYQTEAYNVQVAILVSGILLTAGTGFAAYYMKRMFEKSVAQKQSSAAWGSSQRNGQFRTVESR